MKTRIKYSKLLQIGLLLTYILPFFPQGCNSKQTEDAYKPDSTLVSVDTLRQHSSALAQENKQADTLKAITLGNSTPTSNKTEVTTEDNELSAKISKKSTILKLLLRPNNNYTGIASIIDCFSLVEFGYGLGIAFLLWLIALVVKLIDFNTIFVVINTIGLIFFSLSHSLNIFDKTRLWGYWVCLIWSAILIIYDCIILFKIRKERKETIV